MNRCYCFLVVWLLLQSSVADSIVASNLVDGCTQAKLIYSEACRYTNAEHRKRAFEKAVELCPNYAEAHNNLADALETLALIEKPFTPENVKLKNQLIDRSITEYRKALTIRPDLLPAHIGLASNYFRTGQYEAALIHLKRASEIKPSDPSITELTGEVRQALNERRSGPIQASEIISQCKQLSNAKSHGVKLMGFEGTTVAKGRQKFDNILFDEWSSEVNRPESLTQLDEIGKAFSAKELGNYSFIVEGHTDHRGDYQRNVTLSEDRANQVKKFLTEKYSIEGTRIQTIAYGPNRPLSPGDSPENLQKNRRVEIVFVGK